MFLRRPKATTFAFVSGLLFFASATCAQSFDAVRLFGAAPGKDGGRTGLAVIAGHEYQGSDQSRALAVPLMEYQWANGWFAGSSNGVGFNFSRARNMQYGARLTANFGRDEGSAKALRGMGSIDPRAEIGGFFNYLLSREIALTSSLRYGSGQDSNGLLADLGAGYSTEIAGNLRLGLGLGLTVANAAYMQSYFGVTAAQGTLSGYAPYHPEAGLRDVRTSLSLTYRINPQWSATAAVSASKLSAAATDSPVVRQSSSTTGLMALSYSF